MMYSNNQAISLDTLLRVPQAVNWNYTYRCHMNCAHCYSRDRTDIIEASEAEKQKIADNLMRNHVLSVNFGGGECLLDSKCIGFVKQLNNAGIYTSLSTNGYGITSDTILELKNAGLNQLTVSLDSPNAKDHDEQRRTPGCYDEVLSCLARCADVGLNTMISTVITSRNIHDLEKIIFIAVSNKCISIDLKRLRIAGNAKNLSSLALNESEEEYLFRNIPQWKSQYPITINLSYHFDPVPGIDNGCNCGKKAVTILSNGDISACHYNQIVIGNAIHDDLGDVWLNSPHLMCLRETGHCLGDD